MAATTAAQKREAVKIRQGAVAAGYVSPYPDPGEFPVSSIEDRCESCGWTLFLSLELAVYCPNEKCAEHRRDLRDDVVDDEQFCDECHAGIESSEHHEKCGGEQ